MLGSVRRGPTIKSSFPSLSLSFPSSKWGRKSKQTESGRGRELRRGSLQARALARDWKLSGRAAGRGPSGRMLTHLLAAGAGSWCPTCARAAWTRGRARCGCSARSCRAGPAGQHPRRGGGRAARGGRPVRGAAGAGGRFGWADGAVGGILSPSKSWSAESSGPAFQTAEGNSALETLHRSRPALKQ